MDYQILKSITWLLLELFHFCYCYSDTHLICYFLHSFDAGSIQVVLVSTSLNKQVSLNVLLHLFHWINKVIVTSIDFSFTRFTCCVCTIKEYNKLLFLNRENHTGTLTYTCTANLWQPLHSYFHPVYQQWDAWTLEPCAANPPGAR